MKFRSVAAALALGSCTSLALAQQGPPQPGPDTKKLDAFAGKWEGEGEMKAGPWGPGGKMKSEDECKWFEGGWQLVCESKGEGAMGKVKGQGVMAWSPGGQGLQVHGLRQHGHDDVRDRQRLR